MGASYHKMVKEVRECLANLDTDFPQLKGLKTELCGFVWFQGWNDMCQGEQIRQRVYDEYCPNFAHLVQDLRAEFKLPNLPVVVGELGSAVKMPTRTCSISGPSRRKSRRAPN